MDAETIDSEPLGVQSYEQELTSEQRAQQLMEKASLSSDTNELNLLLQFVDQVISRNEHWRWYLVKGFLLWRLGCYHEMLHVLDEDKELDFDPQCWILRGMAWKSIPDSIEFAVLPCPTKRILSERLVRLLQKIGLPFSVAGCPFSTTQSSFIIGS